ncbi:5'-nucleotidase [Vibrio ishigakensis]|uniref:5'-nucleotidase n=1 Tax=Vibrio ishigakensis TaxID=1481914 RepID=A0A0B8PAP0_9VIBR|nr:5'-nucleotidase [Vibrio ishigakensis]
MQKTITRVRIAHINDTHSYFEPTTIQFDLNLDNQVHKPYISVGGFARIKSRADQLKQQALENDRNFMFLHAGDCFQGTLYFSLFKGRANSDLLNRLGLTAMTLGNHELDMGNGPVAEFAKQIEFPLLCGNWDLSNEDSSKVNPLKGLQSLKPYDISSQAASWITQDVDGEKIAIFGLSIDKMADIANPDPDTPFVNALQTAKNTVKRIRGSGIKKIILLSHLGYEADHELATQITGISLIIGGHSHVLQGDFSVLGIASKDEYGSRVGDTYIVQAGGHAQVIGHCDIDFDADGNVVNFNGKNELLIGRHLCLMQHDRLQLRR